MKKSLLENIKVEKGDLKTIGQYIGTIGYTQDSTIKGVESKLDIQTTAYYVGGITGCNQSSIIKDVLFKGNLNASKSTFFLGGIAAVNNGMIDSAISIGDFYAGYRPAGLVSENTGTLRALFHSGKVDGFSSVSLLVQQNTGTINVNYFNGVILNSTVQKNGLSSDKKQIESYNDYLNTVNTGDLNGSGYVFDIINDELTIVPVN